MADDGFNGRSTTKALSGFETLVSSVLLLRTAWNQELCVADLLQPPVASIANRHRRTSSRDCPALFEDIGQGVAVVNVFIKTHRADDDACGFGDGDGRLTAKFVFLVRFALGDAEDIWLVKAIYLVFIASFLRPDSVEQIQSFLMENQGFSRQFATKIPNKCPPPSCLVSSPFSPPSSVSSAAWEAYA